MPDEDARLTDFLDAGGSTTDDPDGDAGGAGGDDDRDAAASGGPAIEGAERTSNPPATAVDPATSTYRWTGEGARCDGCGAHVQRLWRDDGGLVCSDCKEW